MELLQMVHFHALFFIVWYVVGQNTSEITWPCEKIANIEIIPNTLGFQLFTKETHANIHHMALL